MAQTPKGEQPISFDFELDLEDAVGMLVAGVTAFDSPRAYLEGVREAPEDERVRHLVQMSVALALVARATRAMKTAVAAGMAAEGISVQGMALKLGEDWDKDGIDPEDMVCDSESIEVGEDVLSRSFLPVRQGTKDTLSPTEPDGPAEGRITAIKPDQAVYIPMPGHAANKSSVYGPASMGQRYATFTASSGEMVTFPMNGPKTCTVAEERRFCDWIKDMKLSKEEGLKAARVNGFYEPPEEAVYTVQATNATPMDKVLDMLRMSGSITTIK